MRFSLSSTLLFSTLVAASACSEDVATTPLTDARVPPHDAAQDAAHDTALADADFSPAPSNGCASTTSPLYPPGTTSAELPHGGMTRTFRVHVPPGYDGGASVPVVLMLHGGGGSGRQLEEASARMDPIADREGFIAVYPDGTGALQTWNGGGCCGAAVNNDVDDVGFIAALLDHLEASLCLDRRRVFASGMSNGAILSHRLACELSERIAAIAPVAGTDMTARCTPARPVPVLQIHGSDDGHVPWDGGQGCGLAGVAFTSVPETIDRWRARNGCSSESELYFEEGDATCDRLRDCDDGGEVVLCRIEGGGHNWPGGLPPAGLIECPGNGGQSTTFNASEAIWRFFAMHALP